MAYIDQRLDECVAYGFSGGPEWSTLIVPLENGREQRNAQWLYPKHRYTAQYMNLQSEARDAVLNTFHAMRGQLHCCRFKDWNDYVATHEQINPDVGTSNPVQLIKSYTFGSETSTRLIQAVVTGIIVAEPTPGAPTPVMGTMDKSTGLFTPGSPWADVSDTSGSNYFWTGTFDVWVRFASDYNAFAIGDRDAHTADIELIEVRR